VGPERWFVKDTAVDAEIRNKFQGLYTAAVAGSLGWWEDDTAGTLALLIVLDLFPRNVFRGAAAGRAIERGLDRHVTKENGLMVENHPLTPSSGNLLAGLGFETRQEELLKARLVGEGHAALKPRKQTKAEATDQTGVKPVDMSAIIAGPPWRVASIGLTRAAEVWFATNPLTAHRQRPLHN
jgi:hypothetical protein